MREVWHIRGKHLHKKFHTLKEFAFCELLADVLDAKAYFAHSYDSCERNLNENTNDLIRQYFPKERTFDHLTMKGVRRVENLLSTRPRKQLVSQMLGDIYNSNSPIVLGA